MKKNFTIALKKLNDQYIMAKRILFLGLALVALCSVRLAAQISVAPVFPSADDNITITFNANEGTAGLANLTGDVYGHFGAVIAGQTSTAWTNVIGNWGTADARTKMTSIGGGLYTISFNIRTFYNIPAGTPIFRIACVFRNVDGTKEGKAAGGTDIFYDLIQPGAALQTRLVTPAINGCQLVQNGATISVRGAASQNATLTLTDNGVQIATATNAKELLKDIIVSGTGTRKVVFKAVAGTVVDSQSFVYIVPVATANVPLPAGAELGANINTRGDSVTFVMHAPNKSTVFVIGSFNNYETQTAYQMNKADANTWWIKIGGLTPNQIYTYQYSVDCALRVADALSTLVLDPNNDSRIPATTYPNPVPYPSGKTTGYVSVIQPGKAAYNWRVPTFTRPQKTDLVIYEMLLRDFVAKHDFQTLIDTINYLKKLNINAIELMPVNEYSNNESWGYNPTFHNALDKYYGTPDKFKEFVDLCHQNGIAVICDVVFNHIDNGTLSALYPLNNNPWLNATAPHPYSVFIDMNHESQLTKAYVNRCLKYWLQEYRIDGYRFDLSKGLTQKTSNESTAGNYDQTRIDNLKVYHQTIQQTSAGAYTILEHFCDNSEETALANEGMMVWNKMVFNTNEATMGYTGNSLRGYSAKSRGWNTAANSDKAVGYLESHDEERLMFKNLLYGNVSGSYSVKDLATALRRQELVTPFVYGIPGPRMLWQFGELGYEISIDQNGRTGNKPILWNYFTEPNRKRLYDVTSNMIALRTTQPLFRTTTYDDAELNATYQKVFHLSSTDLNATIVGNFNVVSETFAANFQKTGKWYDYLSGDSINVTNVAATRAYLPGEYHVYLDKRITPPSGFISTRVGTAEFAAQATDFQVYPTPSASGRFYVGYALRNGGEVTYEVFNLQGQNVYRSATKTVISGSHQDEITTPLPSGAYFVRLTVNGAMATQKLIVE
jgi:1,4-alpha-glucan branching enzyme